MMNNYYQKIEEVSGEHSDKPPRHFPLLPGFLVLSAALHLCAAMVWPLNTELPSVGLKQLVLEIQRHDPPGIQATPTVKPQMKVTERPATRPPVKTVKRPPKTDQGKQQIPDVARKPVAPATHDIQQPRKLSREQIEEKLHGHIQQALLPHFSYPVIARRRGWEGTVKISLRVENDGRLTNLQVIEGCKFTALDRAALHSLRQVSGIPEAKQWLAGHYMDMVLPIQYLLLDS